MVARGRHAAFYIPESLADDAECFPPEARSLQEFCMAASRTHSDGWLEPQPWQQLSSPAFVLS
jgi:hypothetical protein